MLVGVRVLALASRLLPVVRGGGLSSVLGYDDAVHHAAAVGLAHGRLPYRDFLLLHPPGVLVALAPAREDVERRREDRQRARLRSAGCPSTTRSVA